MTAPDIFALGGRQDDDAELLALEQEFREINARFAGITGEDAVAALCEVQLDIMTQIHLTEPRTVAGAAVKLRLLANEYHGLAAGELANGSDTVSLDQVLDFVEALAAQERQL
jgi:hypothetical protein